MKYRYCGYMDDTLQWSYFEYCVKCKRTYREFIDFGLGAPWRAIEKER